MWKWSIKSNFVVFLQIGDKWLPISFKLVTVVEYITIYVRVDFNYNMQISMGAINWNVFVNRGPLSLNLKIEEKFRIVFSVCETSIQVSTSKLINLVDFGQNIGTDGFFVRLTSAFLAIWSGIKLMIFLSSTDIGQATPLVQREIVSSTDRRISITFRLFRPRNQPATGIPMPLPSHFDSS